MLLEVDVKTLSSASETDSLDREFFILNYKNV